MYCTGTGTAFTMCVIKGTVALILFPLKTILFCTAYETLPVWVRHSKVLLLYIVAHPFLTLMITLPDPGKVDPQNGGLLPTLP